MQPKTVTYTAHYQESDCDGSYQYTEKRVWTLGYCSPEVIWILSAREHCNWEMTPIATHCDLATKAPGPGIHPDPDSLKRISQLLTMH